MSLPSWGHGHTTRRRDTSLQRLTSSRSALERRRQRHAHSRSGPRPGGRGAGRAARALMLDPRSARSPIATQASASQTAPAPGSPTGAARCGREASDAALSGGAARRRTGPATAPPCIAAAIGHLRGARHSLEAAQRLNLSGARGPEAASHGHAPRARRAHRCCSAPRGRCRRRQASLSCIVRWRWGGRDGMQGALGACSAHLPARTSSQRSRTSLLTASAPGASTHLAQPASTHRVNDG